MRKTIALIAALGFAPIAALAQFNPALGYSSGNTFGNGFPNWGGFGTPSMFPFNGGGYQSGGPVANYGGSQSPFMTIPSPYVPNSAPTASAQMPTAQMTQALPYWMQTPSGTQLQPLYGAGVTGNQQPVQLQSQVLERSSNGQPSTGFAQTQQIAPPRWAPLVGQALPHVPPPSSGNPWAFSPVSQSGATYDPQVQTPVVSRPKWHSE